MAGKHYQDADVHAATLSRLRLVFRNFERVCVAFSGGKDSSVTLQLALDVARELGRSPVDVLFIDLEGAVPGHHRSRQRDARASRRTPLVGLSATQPAQRLQPGGTLLVLLGARRRGRLGAPATEAARGDQRPGVLPLLPLPHGVRGVRRRLQRLAGQGRAYRVPGRHPFGRIAQSLPGGQAQEPGETMRLDAAGRLRAAGYGARATGPTRRR